MKRITLLLAVLIFAKFIIAQNEKGYQFTEVHDITVTSVKNQFKSGTCWSFSGISLLEAEVLREKNIEIDLSDMWIVRYAYYEKAIRYVRFQGHNNFGAGGAFHDVTNMIIKYGIVPEEVYPGLNYGTDKHFHSELDKVLKAYLDVIVENPNKKLTTAWINGFNAILDVYLGELPKSFIYEGKEYNPHSFAKYLGINGNDYITITSFSHHPFYSSFVLELPDNWSHDLAYNVPLSELEEIIDYAIEKGYTVAWASDVSEKGFSWRNGLAIVPEVKIETMEGTERERWERLSQTDRDKETFKFDSPVEEMEINQEIRQIAFDDQTTTDDHGMLITGIFTDQNGNKYYKVKNSWDVNNVYDGYLYASRAFLLYKTTDIMIHKNAVPKNIAKKMKL